MALIGSTDADGVTALIGILRAGAVAAPVPAGLTSREVAVTLEVLAPSMVLRLAGISASDQPFPAPDRDPEAPAVVVLTSGTTGRPKGVVLSSRAMAASADASLARAPPATGWAMPLGLGHVAGLGIVWRAIRGRVPVRIVEPGDPAAFLAALGGAVPVISHAPPAVSHASLVPAQLARVLDAAGDAPPPANLRVVLLGGGHISPALVTRALRAGWPVVPTYGLSGTGSGATALTTGDAWDRPDSAGTALPGVRVAIAGEDRDGVGEIVVRPRHGSSGYLGEPGGSAPAEAPVRTGDLGRLDSAGRLFVTDRRLDRIVRGGENVSPAEVEAILLEHPSIADAAVVACPDDTLGQVPVAAVVLAPGAPCPEDGALAATSGRRSPGTRCRHGSSSSTPCPAQPEPSPRRDAVRALLAGERPASSRGPVATPSAGA